MSGWPPSTMQRDALAFGGGQFLGHEIGVLHEERRRRRGRRSRGAASGARPLRPAAPRPASAPRRVRGARLGGELHPPGQEIGRNRHVLVEERRAARQFLGRVVLQHRADDGALREGDAGLGRGDPGSAAAAALMPSSSSASRRVKPVAVVRGMGAPDSYADPQGAGLQRRIRRAGRILPKRCRFYFFDDSAATTTPCV